ncbi:hypothetical protein [Deinococcus ficus]|nr:hypothetical protein [Deinococcus ficus]
MQRLLPLLALLATSASATHLKDNPNIRNLAAEVYSYTGVEQADCWQSGLDEAKFHKNFKSLPYCFATERNAEFGRRVVEQAARARNASVSAWTFDGKSGWYTATITKGTLSMLAAVIPPNGWSYSVTRIFITPDAGQ